MTWKTSMGSQLGSNERDTPDTPVSASEFQQAVSDYEGDDLREQIASAVDAVWPVVRRKDDHSVVKARTAVPEHNIGAGGDWEPSYRTHQRETVIDVLAQLYVADNDVCLLSAPTGAGKSLLIYSVAMVVNEVTGRRAFTTTPLNTLIDQIGSDDFLDDVITVKGRNNYSCVHPQDAGTPVDEAICQRDSNFECQFKERSHEQGGCPYYGRVFDAQAKPNVVTNLSYLMANSMIPDVADAGFASRELLAIDECQNIEDFALMFVGFTVGPHVVPIDWDQVPSMPSKSASQETVIEWLERDVMRVVTERLDELSAKEDSMLMSEKEQEQLDDLRRFNQKVSNFLGDVRDNHWAMEHDTTYDGDPKIEFKPIKVGRFLHKYMWSQGHKIVTASATIPPSFTEEVGLDGMDVGRVEVPSTFPAERRPIITTESVGKMSWKQRDRTLPKMADRIGRLAEIWEGMKGFIHCHSYSIADKIYQRLPREIQRRTTLQNGDDREESLDIWMDKDTDYTSRYKNEDATGDDSGGGGQVFLSVAMNEGISLDDGLARWQVVAKAAYPHLKDERVSYRMDDDTMDGAEWNWYNAKAIINLQQAAGRGMRSKDDWCATYILDDSAVGLIERNDWLFEDWFLDAVDCDFDEAVVSPENTDEDRADDQSSLDDIADEYFG